MTAKRLILFLDSGDTLIDESTEIRDADGILIEAQPIPGAVELVRRLRERGFRLALVADGDAQSFNNVYKQLGLYDAFEAMIYSEQVKATKPSPPNTWRWPGRTMTSRTRVRCRAARCCSVSIGGTPN